MDLQDIKTVATCQCAFAISVSIVILYFNARYGKKGSSMQLHIITISLSYIGLLSATMISVYRAVYDWGDIWFWIVGPSYLIGDISLFIALRNQVRKHYGLDASSKPEK